MELTQKPSTLLTQKPGTIKICHVPRRGALTAIVATTVPMLLAGSLDDKQAAAAAEFGGDCPTCLGALDGTLGSCSGIEVCSSSYDDRPTHFVAPWQYDGSQEAALQQLLAALQGLGADVQQQASDYVYATLPQGQGDPMDLEFLFAANDNTVALRAAASTASPETSSSMLLGLQSALSKLLGNQPSQVLDSIRLLLRWEEVPILRNRQRLLLFGESPFDSFGPVPPPVPDYARDLDSF